MTTLASISAEGAWTEEYIVKEIFARQLVSIRLFQETPFLEIQDAQSGFLVHGSIETDVRKCVFLKYVSFP